MKVLFTTPMLEYPPKSGPHLRIDNTIKALSNVSELHVLSRVPKFLIGGSRAHEHYEQLSKYFSYTPSVSGLSHSKWFRRGQKLLKYLFANDSQYILSYAKKNQIDVIWYGFGNISYPLIKQLHQVEKRIPTICDTDSVWSRFIERELPFATDQNRRREIQKATSKKQQEEKDWVQWCNITTAVSDVDANYYREYAHDPNKVEIFSNVIDLSFYERPESPPKNFSTKAVLVAGSFGNKNSAMNRAVDWVLESIWPKVKQLMPDAHLYIVGTYSDVAYSHVRDATITVAGRVPSILPYLQNAKVAITPLLFESGTRFKILEAGACKTPMVSTTLGAEGLDVIDQEHILFADEAEDFAKAIVQLIEDPILANKLAINNYNLVKNNFGIDTLERQATSILEKVVSS